MSAPVGSGDARLVRWRDSCWHVAHRSGRFGLLAVGAGRGAPLRALWYEAAGLYARVLGQIEERSFRLVLMLDDCKLR